MHVVIMAAGRGKRLGALTRDFPKALIEVDNAVEHVLVRLAQASTPATHADISGHRWFEVDEPHERESAEAGLAR